MERLFQEVQYLKGVGPQRSRCLQRLGIYTIFDLLWYVPRTYANRQKNGNIDSVQAGTTAALRGWVKSTQNRSLGKGRHVFTAVVQDDSGQISAVWFNQPYLAAVIKPGQAIFISGRVKDGFGIREINVTEFELINENTDKKIVPVYGLTDGLTQRLMRNIVEYVLDQYLNDYPEIFSEKVMAEYQLPFISYAFRHIHFPENRESYQQARKRLAFEELYLFHRLMREDQPGRVVPDGYVIHTDRRGWVEDILKNLPYRLTAAQDRVITSIFHDMGAPLQMNRLLQGDVGSGKTVVAALAIARSVSSGYQAAIMAPTEILCHQHYLSMQNIFHSLPINMALLTGSTSPAMKRLLYEAAAAGEVDLIIGTHALLQEGLVFKNLGLTVIDEQHRFGVRQRGILSSKGSHPDILVMTATPIPRTLALTIYSDLKLTVIDELPPGRKPVLTQYIPGQQRQRVYEFINKELLNHTQAYVVCPLVEESETQDLQAAVSLYEELRIRVFPHAELGLVHGRLKANEKEYIMEAFRKGKVQILVSTSVIEVGMDVPNATIMVVEHADRFGLSQLHQLRGRVGRGIKQSYCFLVAEPRSEEAEKRLKAMEQINDGFKLAEVDLQIRGPGELWGVKQHGLDQLKVANLSRDYHLIEAARRLVNTADLDLPASWGAYLFNKFKKHKLPVKN